MEDWSFNTIQAYFQICPSHVIYGPVAFVIWKVFLQLKWKLRSFAFKKALWELEIKVPVIIIAAV